MGSDGNRGILANAGTGGSTDWKDSARLATDAALPAYTAAGSGVGKTLTADANGILTVDGVAPALNDRILVKDEAAAHVDHGIYTLTTVGTAGVPFVLTRATDSDEDAEMTSGHALAIEEGTNNADEFWSMITNGVITVDTTAMQYTKISDADTNQELSDLRDFVGKSAAGTELPDYTSENIVTDGDNLEVAIGKLDAAVGDARKESTSNGVTAQTTVDSVIVDTVAVVKWIVYAQGTAEADADKKKVVEILATHDGHNVGATDDATDTDYTVYAKLKMGTITGLAFVVDVSGAAGAQVMNLKITSTMSADIRAIREVINF